MNRGPSTDCWKQPSERVTWRPYGDPSDPEVTRFGLLRCTPERPAGCCSIDESAYDTFAEAQRAADEQNEIVRNAALALRIPVFTERFDGWARS